MISMRTRTLAYLIRGQQLNLYVCYNPCANSVMLRWAEIRAVTIASQEDI